MLGTFQKEEKLTAAAEIDVGLMLPWRQAADAQNLPHALVWAWLRQGLLPYCQPVRNILIKPADLEALVAASMMPATAGPLAKK
jgi:hypothetical protein